MPVNTHLQWTRIQEFGGLWTAGNNSLMPANKAQVMSGCHPQPGGGLRAFLKVAKTVDGTNLHQDAVPNPNNRGLGHKVLGFGISNIAESDYNFVDPKLLVVTATSPMALYCADSAANYASTPDAAALDITGDITLRAKLWLSDWTPTVNQGLISNLSSDGKAGYELTLLSTGYLRLTWGDGSTTHNIDSTVQAYDYAGGEQRFVLASLDVNNGAAGHDVKFYTSYNGGLTWSQLGTTVTTAGTTSIAASSEPLKAGRNYAGTARISGLLHYVEVRTGRFGDAGTTVARADFAAQDIGVTSFTNQNPGGTDVWTIQGAAKIVYDIGTQPQNWRFFTRSTPTGVTAWTKQLPAWGDSARVSPEPGQPQFARLIIGTESRTLLAIAHRPDVNNQAGLYTFDAYLNTATRNTTAFNDFDGALNVIEHQSRALAGWRDQVKFSVVDSDNFSGVGSGYFRPNPEGYYIKQADAAKQDGPLIAWMISVPPGDLIVATMDGRIYNVQGDVADPTIRELGRWTTMVPHEPANTPNGVFFILPNQGVARLGLDGSVDVVSKGITPSVWNRMAPPLGVGQIAGTERYLFCPNMHPGADHQNGALVFDMETGAWFTSTHRDDYKITNPRFMQADNLSRDSGVWVVSGSSPTEQGETLPFVFKYRTGGFDGIVKSDYHDVGADYTIDRTTESRGSTWEYKTAPLREPNNRRLTIREVEIPVYAFNNNTSTLAVTVGGTTVTKTLPAGRSIQTYLFRARGIDLDVKVKAKSNDTAVEAPMIEELGIGWQSGHMVA